MREVAIKPHLYARTLKTKTSYSTRLKDGTYVPLGSDLAKAEQKMRALLGVEQENSVAAMCRAFIAEQRRMIAEGDSNRLSPSTVNDYENSFLRQIIPVFGAMRPVDLKPMHAAQFLHRAHTTKNAKGKTRGIRANRDLAALSAAYEYGKRVGIYEIEVNPCRGIKRNREIARRRLVTVAEFNAFIAHAKAKGGSAYLVGLIGALTAISGRRRAEILALPMSALSDDGIRCRGAKQKRGEAARDYLIPWSPLLRQLVAEVQAIQRRSGKVGSLFLFANSDGQPYTDSGFKCLWNRLMHSFAPGGIDSPEWFHAHDLRAMYVSLMLERGINPETHQNEETMRRVYDRRSEIRITPLG